MIVLSERMLDIAPAISFGLTISSIEGVKFSTAFFNGEPSVNDAVQSRWSSLMQSIECLKFR